MSRRGGPPPSGPAGRLRLGLDRLDPTLPAFRLGCVIAAARAPRSLTARTQRDGAHRAVPTNRLPGFVAAALSRAALRASDQVRFTGLAQRGAGRCSKK